MWGVEDMKNEILRDIVEYATKRLTDAYGYCGVASGPELVIINSDDREGHDIRIEIKTEGYE